MSDGRATRSQGRMPRQAKAAQEFYDRFDRLLHVYPPLTDREIASRCGVNETTIYRYRNRQNPPIPNSFERTPW